MYQHRHKKTGWEVKNLTTSQQVLLSFQSNILIQPNQSIRRSDRQWLLVHRVVDTCRVWGSHHSKVESTTTQHADWEEGKLAPISITTQPTDRAEGPLRTYCSVGTADPVTDWLIERTCGRSCFFASVHRACAPPFQCCKSQYIPGTLKPTIDTINIAILCSCPPKYGCIVKGLQDPFRHHYYLVTWFVPDTWIYHVSHNI